MANDEPAQTESDQKFNDSIEGQEDSQLTEEWQTLNFRLFEYTAINPFSFEERVQRDAAIDRISARQREIELRRTQLRQDYAEKILALSPTLSTRERETLLKLVISMAIKGYSYDPSSGKNSATQEIAIDMDSLGIGIDSDTVRKWLKEAAKLLPK